MSGYDVIVVGCGGIGSAALYHLAATGHRVLGIDQYPIGHDRGSSHGETRVIRQAYFEHPDYVPLLQRAYTLWEELQSRSDQRLFHQTGVLQIGSPDGELISGVLRAAREHQLQVQQLDANQVAHEFPGYEVPAGCTAVFETVGGYLAVEDCVRAHADQAVAAGAELVTTESVVDWQATRDAVTVTTSHNSYQAAALVLATGAWAPRWFNQPELRVLRKHLHWFRNTDPRYQQDNGAPVFFYELGDRCFYGFPQRDSLGVKVSEHSGGEVITDPVHLSPDLDRADFAAIAGFLRQHLPGVSGQASRHDVCMYTMSPDGHFILDTHPEHDNVSFVAGLSGHGFKFACVLGELLADLATGRSLRGPELFSLSRFVSQSD